jgi:hypothetical protein
MIMNAQLRNINKNQKLLMSNGITRHTALNMAIRLNMMVVLEVAIGDEGAVLEVYKNGLVTEMYMAYEIEMGVAA